MAKVYYRAERQTASNLGSIETFLPLFQMVERHAGNGDRRRLHVCGRLHAFHIRATNEIYETGGVGYVDAFCDATICCQVFYWLF